MLCSIIIGFSDFKFIANFKIVKNIYTDRFYILYPPANNFISFIWELYNNYI